jgi:GGDEF domain-containing protein
MQLPDRAALLHHVDALGRSHDTGADRRRIDARPAVCVLELVGFELIAANGTSVAEGVEAEVVRRLDQLIRSVDLLAQLEPGRFAVALELAASSAGSVVERMRAAASMPVELGGELVALDAVVGVAIAPPDPWVPGAATALLNRALEEARLQADRGRRS